MSEPVQQAEVIEIGTLNGRVHHGVMVTPAAGPLSPWDAMGLALQITRAAVAAGDFTPCTSCGAPMLMALTQNKARMPLNPGDDPDGNGACWYADGQLWWRSCPLPKQLAPGERRVTSHFATCPHAEAHRRTRRPPRKATG